jgi:hypothetical protein
VWLIWDRRLSNTTIFGALNSLIMGVKSILISAAFSLSFLMAGAQGRWLLTNQKGVSLSYDKEFFVSCDENKYNVYKITAYFANNSGKSILISGALIWHGTTYYVDHCRSRVPMVMGEAEFRVNDVWPTQSLLTIVYYIELPKEMKTVPEPTWNLDPFTFVENPPTKPKPRSGIWESKPNKMAKIELTDKGLIFTNAGIDFNFSKITEDDYEWVKGKYIHIKFSDANNFAVLEYGEDNYRNFTYKSNIPLSSYDPSSNCCDISFFEGEWTDENKKTKINITGNANGFTLKKQNSSVLYQYTLNPMLKYHYSQGKGVFLSMHIENQNEIYCEGIYAQEGHFSEAFYTRLKPIKDTVSKLKTPIVKKEEKPVAPIVKQEDKLAPLTENKTVSNKGGVTGKWYIGLWHMSYTADYSVDVEEMGDNLTIKFTIEPNPTGNNAIEASLSGKIVTAKKSSPYTGQYKDIIGAPVWKGTYPAYEGMVPCSWIYIHDGEKEMLVMLRDDGNIFKHYKTRHSQGY